MTFERIFKQVEISETFEPYDVVKRLGHFDGTVPSLVCILPKYHGVRGGNLKMSLDVSALKNLCL